MYPNWFCETYSKFKIQDCKIPCCLCPLNFENYIDYFDHQLQNHKNHQLNRSLIRKKQFRIFTTIIQRKKSFELIENCKKFQERNKIYCCLICKRQFSETLIYLAHIFHTHPSPIPQEMLDERLSLEKFYKTNFNENCISDLSWKYATHLYIEGPTLDAKIKRFLRKHKHSFSSILECITNILLLPYADYYNRNPRAPIITITDDSDSEN